MAKCKKCGKCCTVIAMPFDAIEFDDKWLEGRSGFRAGMDVFIPSVCKWLKPDNACELGDDRPIFCKNFPMRHGPQAWLANMGCKFYE